MTHHLDAQHVGAARLQRAEQPEEADRMQQAKQNGAGIGACHGLGQHAATLTRTISCVKIGMRDATCMARATRATTPPLDGRAELCMSTWRTPLKARHSRTRRAARGKLESLLVEADDRLGTPLVYERRLVHELVAVLKSDDGH